jgi:hypothetical protein
MTEAWMARGWSAPSRGSSWVSARRWRRGWTLIATPALLLKCAGLTAGQLKERAVPPSRLCLLGLVRHMTEVGRWWFRIHAADTDMAFPYDPDQTGQDFEALEDADAAANLRAFQQEYRTRAPRWPASSLMMSCPATVTTASAPGTSAGSTCT